jgi:hypothetical protein
MEQNDYDRALRPSWRDTLSRALAPLLYPLHGFQMIAAHIGSMAPSGRIVIAALFQAADEMRRIQHIAYRVRTLQLAYPGFAEDRKRLWQKDPAWQPLRRAVERMLVTFDWGEVFVGHNLCLKPLLDALLSRQLVSLAQQSGDPLLAQVLASWGEDARWQREWTIALVKVALADAPDMREVILRFLMDWYAEVGPAVLALATLYSLDQAALAHDLRSDYDAFLAEADLRRHEE